MGIEELKDALGKLENQYHDPDGYTAEDILRQLHIDITDDTQKQCRRNLRSMIDGKKYPEFKTAGDEDIVYCPIGKWSGKYRLSEYRDR